MEFGAVPLDRALGAILAHSQPLASGRIRKGRRLDPGDLARMASEGVENVVVARLADDDCGEDAAAAALARALVPEPDAAFLRLTSASTGRVNLHATRPGILGLDAEAVARLNRLDPAVTLATLPPLARLAEGTMAATIKIISYGVARSIVDRGAALAHGALRVHPVTLADASLVMTDLGGPQGAGKGEAALRQRLERLGMELRDTIVVRHEERAIAEAFRAARGDLLLLLTASATSDARDVGPSGLLAAGGELTRFGMPVDPGNLRFLGRLGRRPVIGLPGCARSPALNGADWVLERVACGMAPTDAEIAAMGIGGLLKESPHRPHPRRKRAV